MMEKRQKSGWETGIKIYIQIIQNNCGRRWEDIFTACKIDQWPLWVHERKNEPHINLDFQSICEYKNILC